MAISSVRYSSAYSNQKIRNMMAQTASTKATGKSAVSSREDTVQLSGTKGAEGASTSAKVKNNTSLPDSMVETIRQMAREGAQKGVYMGDKYIAYINAYKQAHISPPRTQLMGAMTQIFSKSAYTGGKYHTDYLMGFRMNHAVGLWGSYATVYNSDGEPILGYSPMGGFAIWGTKAENKFHSETTAIYAEAYDAAIAEMKAQAASGSGAAAASVDVKA